jgi:uncharacterized membrane protein YidH (DUF202 family)
MKFTWKNILLLLAAIIVIVASITQLVWTYQAQQAAKEVEQQTGVKAQSFVWPYLVNISLVLGSLIVGGVVMYDLFSSGGVDRKLDRLKDIMRNGRRSKMELDA